MIKLPVYKQKLSYNFVTIRQQFCISYELEILFPNINEGVNCLTFLWLRCLLPPNPLAINSIKRIALSSSQVLALLEFFPYALSFSQSVINADIFLPLL